jgi:phosphoribosylaminoimidazole-succinocarboxamide synthase
VARREARQYQVEEEIAVTVGASDGLYDSNLKSLPMIGKGKVRDIYAIGADELLIVATDRLSAYDVVLPTPIPGKGRVLNGLSNFWFARTGHIVANHLSATPLEYAVPNAEERRRIDGCAAVVQRVEPLPIEAIVRGYLVGSGWRDYQKTGEVCGVRLPPEMRNADILEEPIFTPSTKAAVGDHDENITFEEAVNLVGAEIASEVRRMATTIYVEAREYAAGRGIIIADTKMEFGLDTDGRIILIDELLTPDSSRFWPADEYQPGANPPSFDKQYVRDWLDASGWDHTPPGPALPPDVVTKTAEKYREAETRITGAAGQG